MIETRETPKKAVLVYQAGIANVFGVTSFNLSDYGRDAKRLMQSDFRTCESFARGLAVAGVPVRTATCNRAGDITSATWSENLDSQPFSESFRPVFENVVGTLESRSSLEAAERAWAKGEGQ